MTFSAALIAPNIPDKKKRRIDLTETIKTSRPYISCHPST